MRGRGPATRAAGKQAVTRPRRLLKQRTRDGTSSSGPLNRLTMRSGRVSQSVAVHGRLATTTSAAVLCDERRRLPRKQAVAAQDRIQSAIEQLVFSVWFSIR